MLLHSFFVLFVSRTNGSIYGGGGTSSPPPLSRLFDWLLSATEYSNIIRFTFTCILQLVQYVWACLKCIARSLASEMYKCRQVIVVLRLFVGFNFSPGYCSIILHGHIDSSIYARWFNFIHSWNAIDYILRDSEFNNSSQSTIHALSVLL